MHCKYTLLQSKDNRLVEFSKWWIFFRVNFVLRTHEVLLRVDKSLQIFIECNLSVWLISAVIKSISQCQWYAQNKWLIFQILKSSKICYFYTRVTKFIPFFPPKKWNNKMGHHFRFMSSPSFIISIQFNTNAISPFEWANIPFGIVIL